MNNQKFDKILAEVHEKLKTNRLQQNLARELQLRAESNNDEVRKHISCLELLWLAEVESSFNFFETALLSLSKED